MARTTGHQELSKQLSEIDKLNQNFRSLISNESKPLYGVSGNGAEVAALHNAYHSIINNDKQNILNSKNPGLSSYGFIANAIAGSQYGYNNFKLSTGDPNRDKWLNRNKLEKAFTSGDTQMVSYFLSTNSDIMQVYDEIDSICAYIYQLSEAVDVIRDNVLSSDTPGAIINYDVSFPGVSAEDSATFTDIVKDALQYQGIQKKLSTLVIPKLVKYGTYYVMVTPYSDIGYKLASMKRGQTGGATPMFESGGSDIDKCMENITTLYEAIEFGNQSAESRGSSQKLSDHAQLCLNIIKENLKMLEIDEDERGIPDIPDSPLMESFDNSTEKLQDIVKKALKAQSSKNSSTSKNTTSDGVVDPSKSEEDLQGCYLQMCDPRLLRPIKIFNYTVGYYYFENYDYTRMGTSITDLLSNQMNFNEQNMIIDNLVTSVITKLEYGDVLKGDQQFRTMILNCLLYAERRDNPIRIKFISPEYVIPFTTNEDEYGNGQPILLRSLFYGRLYTSLLLFNITAIITKSTDTEFYWLKQSGLDQQYSNQVSDLIDQMKASNVDPLAIANGNILHGNSAINKRYYMNAGVSGERPFDMEVVSGQQVDIHNDLLTTLLKMTIGSSGVPAAMIDLVDEVEYATQLTMANIKNLKRCNSIQTDVDPSLTLLAKTIIRYNYPNVIPDDILDNMTITLKRSKIVEGNITNQQISDAQSTASTMVDTWCANNDTDPPEISKFIKANMVKELTMELTSSAPWGLMQDIYERSVIAARKQQLEQQAQSENISSGSEEGSEY